MNGGLSKMLDPVVVAPVVCFLAVMVVCVYIVHKEGAEGLRHFAEVLRALWRPRR